MIFHNLFSVLFIDSNFKKYDYQENLQELIVSYTIGMMTS